MHVYKCVFEHVRSSLSDSEHDQRDRVKYVRMFAWMYSAACTCMLMCMRAWVRVCVFFSVLGDGVAAAGAQPADIQTGFLASLPGRSPSQWFVGGPGEGGGTPFAWLNIPVCSFPGDETFVSL